MQKINNRTPDGGINKTMYVDINGTKQWINIYGQNKDAPVLLYLHGGPGSATSDMDYPVLRKLSDIYNIQPLLVSATLNYGGGLRSYEA